MSAENPRQQSNGLRQNSRQEVGRQRRPELLQGIGTLLNTGADRTVPPLTVMIRLRSQIESRKQHRQYQQKAGQNGNKQPLPVARVMFE